MIVIVNDHDYQMTRKQADHVIEVAGRQMNSGIFAVENDSLVFLKNHKLDNEDDLDLVANSYLEKGFIVHAKFNGKEKKYIQKQRKGRWGKRMDRQLFYQLCEEYIRGETSSVNAAKELGITQPTFLRRANQYVLNGRLPEYMFKDG